MLLRVRVTLPDRPGALGQVARTLGVAGADIVQVVVLERLGGRAVDDFTVVWPGAARVERLMGGLAAIPGVRVDGVWRAIGAPVAGGHDSELLAQVAANPDDGLATLVDAVPGLLAADWAAAVVVPPDWASRSGLPPRADQSAGAEAALVYASWRAPVESGLPEVTPLRARALDGPDGTRFAAAPFGRAGLVLLVARLPDDIAAASPSDGLLAGSGYGSGRAGEPDWPAAEELPAASFHVTEVDRIAQLVKAAAVMLGARLDEAAGPSVQPSVRPVATAVAAQRAVSAVAPPT
jgi:hypothetical protein